MFGLERSLGRRIVTYADDLVILCRRGKAEAALQSLRAIMGELKLTVNEEKTRICRRIGRSTLTQRCGCAGGCAPSTKSGDEGAGAIHSRTSTGTSTLFAIFSAKPLRGRDCPISTRTCLGIHWFTSPMTGSSMPKPSRRGRRTSGMKAGLRRFQVTAPSHLRGFGLSHSSPPGPGRGRPCSNNDLARTLSDISALLSCQPGWMFPVKMPLRFFSTCRHHPANSCYRMSCATAGRLGPTTPSATPYAEEASRRAGIPPTGPPGERYSVS